ncbi:hypothetical protein [Flavobacterium poyangense]|uniref:hypothetical protein n=1 Tax=Flavobacterium poyangense TaxID=2204302 RepID=UPI00141FB7FB|nr:hypothetical protein [Flavobacterium sp. JXAS1]
METNEIKNLENLRKLTTQYFSTLNQTNNKTGGHITQIKLSDYNELGYTITNMLKLCVLALDQDRHQISEAENDSTINVALVLEIVLQLFPVDEFEFLSEISQIQIGDSQSVTT